MRLPAEICNAVGLELYIGPPETGRGDGQAASGSYLARLEETARALNEIVHWAMCRDRMCPSFGRDLDVDLPHGRGQDQPRLLPRGPGFLADDPDQREQRVRRVGCRLDQVVSQ